MRFQKISAFRLALAMATIIVLAWLHWSVFPTMGIFRFAKDCIIPDDTGYYLVLLDHGKSRDACALKMVQIGLPVLWAAWPYVFVGLLCGTVFGYPMGELARRRFVIDGASDVAIRLSEELKRDAFVMDRRATIKLQEAQALDAQTQSMQGKLEQKEHATYVMKVAAEAQMEAAQGFRQRADSLQKELDKARAKIRRLEENHGRQTRRPKEKPIDEDQYPY